MNAKIHQLETGAKFGLFNLQWLRFLYHIIFGLREGTYYYLFLTTGEDRI
jgi:hypothetical protein